MTSILRTATATAALSIAGFAGFADTMTNKDIAVGLLEQGLVKGDTDFINRHVAEGYIQHNPMAATGREGLLGFVGFLGTLEDPVKVAPLRVLAEGDIVVIHQESEFFGPKVIIDVFRFEDGKIAEHWDSIQEKVTETASGRSMVDGATEISDLDLTAANKELVTGLVTDVLMNGQIDKIDAYIAPDYMQHNPFVADTRDGLKNFIAYLGENNISFGYSDLHMVVAEGNFVFTQAEGIYDGAPTAFYDIWRVEDGKIVEHWDVVQEIPTEFAHENGMF